MWPRPRHLQPAAVGDEAAAMRRMRSDGRPGVLLACLLMAGCAAVGAGDVPPAAAAAANVAVVRAERGCASPSELQFGNTTNEQLAQKLS